MPTTPEVLKPELSNFQERQEEFVIDETLKNAGANVVQKNFASQVRGDKGIPLIQTPPSQVITVNPPQPQQILVQQAKGPITSSLTWLATFWLRIIKKAMHFGWQVISK